MKKKKFTTKAYITNKEGQCIMLLYHNDESPFVVHGPAIAYIPCNLPCSGKYVTYNLSPGLIESLKEEGLIIHEVD